MIEFKLLGTFTAIVNGKKVNLQKTLGKQMSNLFALFIYYHNEIVTKEHLIEWIWPESDNPTNAIKYGIFRLRNALKEIDGFENIEWIKTAKRGYCLNNELEYSVDVDDFERILDEKGNLEEAIDLYQDNFLQYMDVDWVFRRRSYYLSQYLDVVKVVGNECLSQGEIEKVIAITERALKYDTYDEDIVKLYLIGLVKNLQYNNAISYYEYIKKKFLTDLGVTFEFSIADYTGDQYEAVIEELAESEVVRVETFDTVIDDIEATEDRKGAMLCGIEVFKDYARYEICVGMRNNENKYVLCIHIEAPEDILAKASIEMAKCITRCMRTNDIFTQLNQNDFAILVTIRNDKDVDIIMDRLRTVYYHSMSQDVSVEVKFRNLIKEKTAR